jgi:hypothetical protein
VTAKNQVLSVTIEFCQAFRLDWQALLTLYRWGCMLSRRLHAVTALCHERHEGRQAGCAVSRRQTCFLVLLQALCSVFLRD